MEKTDMYNSSMVSTSHDVEESWDDEFQQLVQTFPKDKSFTGMNLYFFQGFWCPSIVLKAVISCQKHFQAFDSDILIATLPKCGTTWLKALTFSILYRSQFARENNPLLTYNPHSLVRFIDYDFYLNDTCPDLENCTLYQPRLFSIHLPYASLPTSIKDSNWYWRASQEKPSKILFLQYEDLKEDINSHLKKLAMFLGVPFTEEEEKQGVVEEIAKICSFENMKDLEVNKKGVQTFGNPQETFLEKAKTFEIPCEAFFRKAKMGDWSNYLTPSMVVRLEKLIQEKLDNSGLTFKLFSKTSKDITST
ncbi:cytosolic sulfotransferase 15 [Gossypium hirsutum]|uniref:Sulfotransferase n=1 Tax=Gossypium hirsutum TaxID=3635 RepID=A0A1U8P9L5_GOSHI|nr:cytosolic sulfotransferase 15-like [Gossypium hirsutum]